MNETTAAATNICSYCQKPFEGFHICGNTLVPPASLTIDPAAARLQEIRDKGLTSDHDYDIPIETRREFMQCATNNGRISYDYLCDIWRRGKRVGEAQSATSTPLEDQPGK
jgi:hypothetical protein